MERKRPDYPQVDYIDDNGVQHIELNRGCRRQCEFCYADPNFKQFPIPEIRSRIVQIIGEGFLYDTRIKQNLLQELGKIRYKAKVVYYGLSQGIDYRLLDKQIAEQLSKNRIGVINNKGKWYKGMRMAWDWRMEQYRDIKNSIRLLEKKGYVRRFMLIFILVNWKIDYKFCLRKFKLLKGNKVKIDGCTWNTTKRVIQSHYWTEEELRIFKKKCRDHNYDINFRGYKKKDHLKDHNK